MQQFIKSKFAGFINLGVQESDSLEEQKRKRIVNTSIVVGLLLISPTHILIVCIKEDFHALWAEGTYLIGIYLYYHFLLKKRKFIYSALAWAVTMLLMFTLISWRASEQEPITFMFLLWCLGVAAYFPKAYWWKSGLIVVALALYFAFYYYHQKYLPFSEAHALGVIPMLVCYFLLMRFIETEQDNHQKIIISQSEKLQHQNEALKNQNTAIEKARITEKRLHEEVLATKERMLAKQAFQLVERNQALTPLTKRLSELAKSLDEPFAAEASEIGRILQRHLDDKIWQKFLLQFETIHPRFFEQLKLKHPELTVNDLKTCAYLKVGLSNQELSQTINITPASTKKKLNRLKKKLGLDAEDSLRAYLINVSEIK